MKYTNYKAEDYLIFVAIYIIFRKVNIEIKENLKTAVKKLIPKPIYKQKKKKEWIKLVRN